MLIQIHIYKFLEYNFADLSYVYCILGSWLPNVTNNDSTTSTSSSTSIAYVGYFISISTNDAVSSNQISWKIIRRFSEFHSLYCKISSYISRSFKNGSMTYPFRDDRMKVWMLGSTDNICNTRKDNLDGWLREIMTSPLMMTVPAVRDAVYKFLDAFTELKKKKVSHSKLLDEGGIAAGKVSNEKIESQVNVGNKEEKKLSVMKHVPRSSPQQTDVSRSSKLSHQYASTSSLGKSTKNPFDDDEEEKTVDVNVSRSSNPFAEDFCDDSNESCDGSSAPPPPQCDGSSAPPPPPKPPKPSKLNKDVNVTDNAYASTPMLHNVDAGTPPVPPPKAKKPRDRPSSAGRNDTRRRLSSAEGTTQSYTTDSADGGGRGSEPHGDYHGPARGVKVRKNK